MNGANVLHELKCWPKPFQAVWDGDKRYEIREDDREFKVGDLLKLREFVPHAPCAGSGRVWDNGDRTDCGCEKPHGEYTGRTMEVSVTYKTEGGEWGLPDELCVLGVSVPIRLSAARGVYVFDIPAEATLPRGQMHIEQHGEQIVLRTSDGRRFPLKARET